MLKCVGKLAYYIELLHIYSILHNVFHVSYLKLYVPGGGDGTSTNVQPVLVDGEEQQEVKKIVAECGHGKYKQYLVHWVIYLAEHDLWLPAFKLMQALEVLAAWKQQLDN